MPVNNELILTTCQTSLQWSACVWNYNTGNAVQIYKGGGSATPKTLSQIGNDYVMFAEQNKPLLHVWPVNSQEEIKTIRLILPEPARVLAVCPNNLYLAVGIGLKLYVWQLSSGKLLTVQQKHFQPITCIRFSNTCEHVIVGGQDGMLVTYNFGDLVSLQTNYLPQTEMGQVEPMYSKMDHSSPISDVHVGNFGTKSRLATVSSDGTCRIYALHSGKLLLNLVFGEPISSVVFDKACWLLYVGTNTGKISQFSLKEPPRSLELHVTEEEKERHNFVGHAKKITCLTLNFSDDLLASGSDDFKVFVWEVKTRQIIRTLEHKEAITNVRFLLGHRNFTEKTWKPSVCLNTLERNLNLEPENFVVSVIQEQDIKIDDEESSEPEESDEVAKLQAELDEMKAINRQMYLALKKVNDGKHTGKQSQV